MQRVHNLHLSQDTIVRATAGAGKTTKLIEDVFKTYQTHKFEFGKPPRILLTTFTVKAANELSERLFSKAIKEKDEEFLNYSLSAYLEIGTMHSIFSSLLNQLDPELSPKTYVSQSYKLNCAKGILTKVIEEKQMHSVLSEPYDFNETLKFFLDLQRHSQTYETSSKEEIFEDFKDQVLNLVHGDMEVSNSLNSCKSFDDIQNSASALDAKEYKDLIKFITKEGNKSYFIDAFYERNKEIKKLYESWEERFSAFIKEKGLYTLEDMESLILNLSKEKKIESRWDYCFFDEYQDTSPEQKDLIDRFCFNSIKYFVGDPFQSIYFFRGARKEIFDKEFNRIKEEDLTVEYKTTSYRSAKNIVNFVNAVSMKMFSDFDEMTPNKEENGSVKVAFFEDKSIDEEINFLIEQIKDLEPKEVLILSKHTKNLSKAFKALKENNMPALPLYGSGVTDHLQSFEIVSLLKFLADKNNNESLLTILFSNVFNFTDTEVAGFLVNVEKSNLSLWEVVSNDERLVLLKNLVGGDLDFSSALRVFIAESGFINKSLRSDNARLKEFNSFKILQALEEEEAKPSFNLKAFCEDLLTSQYPFGKESVEESDSYRLMTVHGSKGLEAKHVFIIGSNQGYRDLDNYPLYFDEEMKNASAKTKDKDQNRIFPALQQRLIEKEKLVKKEESRRLFYVAMTRAEVKLTIIGSGKKEKTPSEPSWMTHAIKVVESSSLAGVEFITDEAEKPDANETEANKKYDFFLNQKALDLPYFNTESVQSYNSSDLFELSKNIKKGVDFHSYMEGAQEFQSSEFDKAYEYLKEQRDFPFNDIFSKGFKEWGYDWLNPETHKIESGKIDIWAELDDSIWIVDYKTGSLFGVDKGFDQLNRYAKVIKSYLETEKSLKVVLAFPFAEKSIIRNF